MADAGGPGKRECIVRTVVHTGGPGPTVSFAKGSFYYGDKRDTVWNNEMNYREMLTKESRQQQLTMKENDRKDAELLRSTEEQGYNDMVSRITRHARHTPRVPGMETWRRNGGLTQPMPSNRLRPIDSRGVPRTPYMGGPLVSHQHYKHCCNYALLFSFVTAG